ncbi:hypothetical protein COV94_03035 [Candidatus Woesearchaeota archaeon CG11_big_fil_rev_8_21_14_0_20_57_5]|nr:MAG: hypothetical protein COV94_03035 [Candidatus Woesearchaeota archaeon CG11_big_fil_rev_8_21_14_0_20_57_5]
MSFIQHKTIHLQSYTHSLGIRPLPLRLEEVLLALHQLPTGDEHALRLRSPREQRALTNAILRELPKEEMFDWAPYS